MLWLGTILQEREINEATTFLKELLDSKTLQIECTYRVDDISIVKMSIDESDIPRVAMTRLKTNDIKWEMDFPQYQLENDTNTVFDIIKYNI